MIEWFRQNWYLITGIGGAAVFIAVRMHRDGVEGPFVRRLLYAIMPVLNPYSSERKSLTPRAIVLALVGLLIVAVVSLIVPG